MDVLVAPEAEGWFLAETDKYSEAAVEVACWPRIHPAPARMVRHKHSKVTAAKERKKRAAASRKPPAGAEIPVRLFSEKCLFAHTWGARRCWQAKQLHRAQHMGYVGTLAGP